MMPVIASQALPLDAEVPEILFEVGRVSVTDGQGTASDTFRVGFACVTTPEATIYQVPWTIANGAVPPVQTNITLRVYDAPIGSTSASPGIQLGQDSVQVSGAYSGSGTLQLPIPVDSPTSSRFVEVAITNIIGATTTEQNLRTLVHYLCVPPASAADVFTALGPIQQHVMYICNMEKRVGLRYPQAVFSAPSPSVIGAPGYVRSYIDAGDPCAAIDSARSNCEFNGECDCGSQEAPDPRRDPQEFVLALVADPQGTANQFLFPEPDTDQDGVPDSRDPDDDCDTLGDRLELALSLPTTVPDDPFDLTPHAVGINIWLSITAYTVAGCDDQYQGCDPYMTGAQILTHADDYAGDQIGVIPSFSLVDHQHDTAYTFPLSGECAPVGGQTECWSKAIYKSEPYTDNFLDLETWSRRGPPVSGGSVATGEPQLELIVKLMEHDSHAEEGDGEDDELHDSVLDSLALRDIAGGALNTVGGVIAPMPWDPDPLATATSTEGIDLDVRFAASLCPAAIDWAQRASAQMVLTDLEDVSQAMGLDQC